ncbi:mucin-4-like [Ranitomeya imitator]|uniref:mucin-4-like n=1 Tax=Ranitomeya imitator TaxID=111125 RepID=UPI0037E6F956
MKNVLEPYADVASNNYLLQTEKCKVLRFKLQLDCVSVHAETYEEGLQQLRGDPEGAVSKEAKTKSAALRVTSSVVSNITSDIINSGTLTSRQTDKITTSANLKVSGLGTITSSTLAQMIKSTGQASSTGATFRKSFQEITGSSRTNAYNYTSTIYFPSVAPGDQSSSPLQTKGSPSAEDASYVFKTTKLTTDRELSSTYTLLDNQSKITIQPESKVSITGYNTNRDLPEITNVFTMYIETSNANTENEQQGSSLDTPNVQDITSKVTAFLSSASAIKENMSTADLDTNMQGSSSHHVSPIFFNAGSSASSSKTIGNSTDATTMDVATLFEKEFDTVKNSDSKMSSQKILNYETDGKGAPSVTPSMTVRPSMLLSQDSTLQHTTTEDSVITDVTSLKSESKESLETAKTISPSWQNNIYSSVSPISKDFLTSEKNIGVTLSSTVETSISNLDSSSLSANVTTSPTFEVTSLISDLVTSDFTALPTSLHDISITSTKPEGNLTSVDLSIPTNKVFVTTDLREQNNIIATGSSMGITGPPTINPSTISLLSMDTSTISGNNIESLPTLDISVHALSSTITSISESKGSENLSKTSSVKLISTEENSDTRTTSETLSCWSSSELAVTESRVSISLNKEHTGVSSQPPGTNAEHSIITESSEPDSLASMNSTMATTNTMRVTSSNTVEMSEIFIPTSNFNPEKAENLLSGITSKQLTSRKDIFSKSHTEIKTYPMQEKLNTEIKTVYSNEEKSIEPITSTAISTASTFSSTNIFSTAVHNSLTYDSMENVATATRTHINANLSTVSYENNDDLETSTTRFNTKINSQFIITRSKTLSTTIEDDDLDHVPKTKSDFQDPHSEDSQSASPISSTVISKLNTDISSTSSPRTSQFISSLTEMSMSSITETTSLLPLISQVIPTSSNLGAESTSSFDINYSVSTPDVKNRTTKSNESKGSHAYSTEITAQSRSNTSDSAIIASSFINNSLVSSIPSTYPRMEEVDTMENLLDETSNNAAMTVTNTVQNVNSMTSSHAKVTGHSTFNMLKTNHASTTSYTSLWTINNHDNDILWSQYNTAIPDLVSSTKTYPDERNLEETMIMSTDGTYTEEAMKTITNFSEASSENPSSTNLEAKIATQSEEATSLRTDGTYIGETKKSQFLTHSIDAMNTGDIANNMDHNTHLREMNAISDTTYSEETSKKAFVTHAIETFKNSDITPSEVTQLQTTLGERNDITHSKQISNQSPDVTYSEEILSKSPNVTNVEFVHTILYSTYLEDKTNAMADITYSEVTSNAMDGKSATETTNIAGTQSAESASATLNITTSEETTIKEPPITHKEMTTANRIFSGLTSSNTPTLSEDTSKIEDFAHTEKSISRWMDNLLSQETTNRSHTESSDKIRRITYKETMNTTLTGSNTEGIMTKTANVTLSDGDKRTLTYSPHYEENTIVQTDVPQEISSQLDVSLSEERSSRGTGASSVSTYVAQAEKTSNKMSHTANSEVSADANSSTSSNPDLISSEKTSDTAPITQHTSRDPNMTKDEKKSSTRTYPTSLQEITKHIDDIQSEKTESKAPNLIGKYIVTGNEVTVSEESGVMYSEGTSTIKSGVTNSEEAMSTVTDLKYSKDKISQSSDNKSSVGTTHNSLHVTNVEHSSTWNKHANATNSQEASKMPDLAQFQQTNKIQAVTQSEEISSTNQGFTTISMNTTPGAKSSVWKTRNRTNGATVDETNETSDATYPSGASRPMVPYSGQTASESTDVQNSNLFPFVTPLKETSGVLLSVQSKGATRREQQVTQSKLTSISRDVTQSGTIPNKTSFIPITGISMSANTDTPLAAGTTGRRLDVSFLEETSVSSDTTQLENTSKRKSVTKLKENTSARIGFLHITSQKINSSQHDETASNTPDIHFSAETMSKNPNVSILETTVSTRSDGIYSGVITSKVADVSVIETSEISYAEETSSNNPNVTTVEITMRKSDGSEASEVMDVTHSEDTLSETPNNSYAKGTSSNHSNVTNKLTTVSPNSDGGETNDVPDVTHSEDTWSKIPVNSYSRETSRSNADATNIQKNKSTKSDAINSRVIISDVPDFTHSEDSVIKTSAVTYSEETSLNYGSLINLEQTVSTKSDGCVTSDKMDDTRSKNKVSKAPEITYSGETSSNIPAKVATMDTTVNTTSDGIYSGGITSAVSGHTMSNALAVTSSSNNQVITNVQTTSSTKSDGGVTSDVPDDTHSEDTVRKTNVTYSEKTSSNNATVTNVEISAKLESGVATGMSNVAHSENTVSKTPAVTNSGDSSRNNPNVTNIQTAITRRSDVINSGSMPSKIPNIASSEGTLSKTPDVTHSKEISRNNHDATKTETTVSSRSNSIYSRGVIQDYLDVTYSEDTVRKTPDVTRSEETSSYNPNVTNILIATTRRSDVINSEGMPSKMPNIASSENTVNKPPDVTHSKETSSNNPSVTKIETTLSARSNGMYSRGVTKSEVLDVTHSENAGSKSSEVTNSEEPSSNNYNVINTKTAISAEAGVTSDMLDFTHSEDAESKTTDNIYSEETPRNNSNVTHMQTSVSTKSDGGDTNDVRIIIHSETTVSKTQDGTYSGETSSNDPTYLQTTMSTTSDAIHLLGTISDVLDVTHSEDTVSKAQDGTYSGETSSNDPAYLQTTMSTRSDAIYLLGTISDVLDVTHSEDTVSKTQDGTYSGETSSNDPAYLQTTMSTRSDVIHLLGTISDVLDVTHSEDTVSKAQDGTYSGETSSNDPAYLQTTMSTRSDAIYLLGTISDVLDVTHSEDTVSKAQDGTYSGETSSNDPAYLQTTMSTRSEAIYLLGTISDVLDVTHSEDTVSKAQDGTYSGETSSNDPAYLQTTMSTRSDAIYLLGTISDVLDVTHFEDTVSKTQDGTYSGETSSNDPAYLQTTMSTRSDAIYLLGTISDVLDVTHSEDTVSKAQDGTYSGNTSSNDPAYLQTTMSTRSDAISLLGTISDVLDVTHSEDTVSKAQDGTYSGETSSNDPTYLQTTMSTRSEAIYLLGTISDVLDVTHSEDTVSKAQDGTYSGETSSNNPAYLQTTMSTRSDAIYLLGTISDVLDVTHFEDTVSKAQDGTYSGETSSNDPTYLQTTMSTRSEAIYLLGTISDVLNVTHSEDTVSKAQDGTYSGETSSNDPTYLQTTMSTRSDAIYLLGTISDVLDVTHSEDTMSKTSVFTYYEGTSSNNANVTNMDSTVSTMSDGSVTIKGLAITHSENTMNKASENAYSEETSSNSPNIPTIEITVKTTSEGIYSGGITSEVPDITHFEHTLSKTTDFRYSKKTSSNNPNVTSVEASVSKKDLLDVTRSEDTIGKTPDVNDSEKMSTNNANITNVQTKVSATFEKGTTDVPHVTYSENTMSTDSGVTYSEESSSDNPKVATIGKSMKSTFNDIYLKNVTSKVLNVTISGNTVTKTPDNTYLEKISSNNPTSTSPDGKYAGAIMSDISDFTLSEDTVSKIINDVNSGKNSNNNTNAASIKRTAGSVTSETLDLTHFENTVSETSEVTDAIETSRVDPNIATIEGTVSIKSGDGKISEVPDVTHFGNSLSETPNVTHSEETSSNNTKVPNIQINTWPGDIYSGGITRDALDLGHSENAKTSKKLSKTSEVAYSENTSSNNSNVTNIERAVSARSDSKYSGPITSEVPDFTHSHDTVIKTSKVSYSGEISSNYFKITNVETAVGTKSEGGVSREVTDGTLSEDTVSKTPDVIEDSGTKNPDVTGLGETSCKNPIATNIETENARSDDVTESDVTNSGNNLRKTKSITQSEGTSNINLVNVTNPKTTVTTLSDEVYAGGKASEGSDVTHSEYSVSKSLDLVKRTSNRQDNLFSRANQESTGVEQRSQKADAINLQEVSKAPIETSTISYKTSYVTLSNDISVTSSNVIISPYGTISKEIIKTQTYPEEVINAKPNITISQETMIGSSNATFSKASTISLPRVTHLVEMTHLTEVMIKGQDVTYSDEIRKQTSDTHVTANTKKPEDTISGLSNSTVIPSTYLKSVMTQESYPGLNVTTLAQRVSSKETLINNAVSTASSDKIYSKKTTSTNNYVEENTTNFPTSQIKTNRMFNVSTNLPPSTANHFAFRTIEPLQTLTDSSMEIWSSSTADTSQPVHPVTTSEASIVTNTTPTSTQHKTTYKQIDSNAQTEARVSIPTTLGEMVSTVSAPITNHTTDKSSTSGTSKRSSTHTSAPVTTTSNRVLGNSFNTACAFYVPAVSLFAYGESAGDIPYVQRRTDFTSPLFQPVMGFPFGNQLRRFLYYTDNGQIIFPVSRSNIFSYTNPPINGFTADYKVATIAVFWDDADFSKNMGNTYYKEYIKSASAEENFITEVEDMIWRYMNTSYTAQWTLKITWENVPAYPAKDNDFQTSTYQVVLTTDGFVSYILMLYKEGSMNWDVTSHLTEVVIGYCSGTSNNFFKNDDIMRRPAYEKYRPSSFVGYNSDMKGLWIYALNSNSVNNSRMECLNWYFAQPESSQWNSNLLSCPCSYQQGLADVRYRTIKSDEEIQAHDWCCNEVDDPQFCEMYKEKRPAVNCWDYKPLFSGWMFGDPHITTLDGLNYTFNGLGDFLLLDASDSDISLVLQGRTVQTEPANATNFQAFAVQYTSRNGSVKELNIRLEAANQLPMPVADVVWMTIQMCGRELGRKEIVQVEWYLSNDIISTYVNGHAVNFRYSEDMNAQINNSNPSVFLRYDDSITATFGGLLSVSVSAYSGILNAIISLPSQFLNKTQGLLGLWNWNISDDLMRPDYTFISHKSTEEEIFNYGKTCFMPPKIMGDSYVQAFKMEKFIICSCQFSSECNYTEITRVNSSSLYVASCNCIDNYTGIFCHEQINPCSQGCYINVSCDPVKGCGSCPPGLSGDGLHCSDFDECSQNLCSANAACRNTLMSYHCTCMDGYIGNGYECTSVCGPCNPNYCGNGQPCSRVGSTCEQKCNCHPMFSDNRCLEAGNRYIPDAAENTLDQLVPYFTCSLYDYSEYTLNKETFTCESNCKTTCQNNATCVHMKDEIICRNKLLN